MVNNFRLLLVSLYVALVGSASIAEADQLPKLIGTWSGTIIGGARFGALNHDPMEKDPVFADRNKEWTLEIERQDGVGIIGTWSTKTKQERIVGAIRQDNVTVIFADEDNVFDARLLSSKKMELCAQEGRAAKGGATIAVCYLLMRE